MLCTLHVLMHVLMLTYTEAKQCLIKNRQFVITQHVCLIALSMEVVKFKFPSLAYYHEHISIYPYITLSCQWLQQMLAVVSLKVNNLRRFTL